MIKIRKSSYYLAGAVSLLTFVVYLSSLGNDFVGWDDGSYVVNNPFIRLLNGAFFKWAFFDFYSSNWHPLTWISHALDYAVWGLNPLGHHLTNNILHAINTFLVVLLVVSLIEAVLSRQPLSSRVVEWSNGRVVEWSSSNNPTTQQLNSSSSPFTIHDSRFSLIAAAVTGLLFGLHPVHVESVAWVAERKDLLCALFYLLSIMMYMRYAGRGNPLWLPFLGRPQGAAPTWSYFLSLCFFTLALLSKPMAVSLPAVLLILDWYPFKRITSLKTFRTSFIEKLPFIALSIASSIVTIMAQKAGGSVAPMTVLPFSARMLVAAKSLIAYLWKMILPLNLVPLYPYPRNISFLSLEFLAPMFLVGVITAACMGMLRKEKLWFSVWLYYVVSLLPVIGIVQVGSQPMADRYTYLPGLGPFLIAGMITAGIYEKSGTSIKRGALLKAGSIVTASVVLVFMSYATIRQIGIWRDGITLWNHEIEKEPLKVPLAYNNGGFALMEKGRMDEAIEYFQIAIRLDPMDEKAFNNLGLAYNSKGLYDKAIDQFRAALSLKPDDPEVHNNLGVAYKYNGMFDKAVEEHRTALRLKPAYAEAHFNLGVIYLDSGAVDKAREEFEAGLEIKPDDQKARQVLNEISSR